MQQQQRRPMFPMLAQRRPRLQARRQQLSDGRQGLVATDGYGNEIVIDEGGGEIMGWEDPTMFSDYEPFEGDDGEDDRIESEFGAIEDEIDLLQADDNEYDLDDDEFGAREDRVDKKIARLENRKDKWEAKLSGARNKRQANRARKNIQKIDRKLAKARQKLRRVSVNRSSKRQRDPAVISRGRAAGRLGRRVRSPGASRAVANQRATAGVRATSLTPYGEGHQLPIPMTQAGATTPRQSITIPAALASAAVNLLAEDISYSTYRITSFATSSYGTDPTAAVNSYVEDFKIAGGTNLFFHEHAVGIEMYDVSNDRVWGLRDNPQVKSPNQAIVTTHGEGDLNDVMTFECYTIGDVILDDVYGPVPQAPYAG